MIHRHQPLAKSRSATRLTIIFAAALGNPTIKAPMTKNKGVKGMDLTPRHKLAQIRLRGKAHHRGRCLAAPDHGMPSFMLSAYLGIVSPAGLDVMVPEHEHTLLFLLRRLARQTRRRECGVWFVLPQETAEEVRWLLEAGERCEALRWSQLGARDYGVLMPESHAEI
jgi:hypothetical protein